MAIILTEKALTRSILSEVSGKSVISVTATQHPALDNCLLDFIRVAIASAPDRMRLFQGHVLRLEVGQGSKKRGVQD